jgi:hypothetical protein
LKNGTVKRGKKNAATNLRREEILSKYGELTHITCRDWRLTERLVTQEQQKKTEANTLMTEGEPPFTLFLTSFHDLALPMVAKDADKLFSKKKSERFQKEWGLNSVNKEWWWMRIAHQHAWIGDTIRLLATIWPNLADQPVLPAKAVRSVPTKTWLRCADISRYKPWPPSSSTYQAVSHVYLKSRRC